MVLLHISSSPFVSALATVLPQWAVGSPVVRTSNTSASICWARADALAGLETVASGKPLLINQICRVTALITINILDSDDEDAVQSLSANTPTRPSTATHSPQDTHALHLILSG